MKKAKWILLFGWFICLSLPSWAAELVLLETVPIKSLGPSAVEWPVNFTLKDEMVEDFGFLRGGKLVFFGKGGWAYDLEQRKLIKPFPDNL